LRAGQPPNLAIPAAPWSLPRSLPDLVHHGQPRLRNWGRQLQPQRPAAPRRTLSEQRPTRRAATRRSTSPPAEICLGSMEKSSAARGDRVRTRTTKWRGPDPIRGPASWATASPRIWRLIRSSADTRRLHDRGRIVAPRSTYGLVGRSAVRKRPRRLARVRLRRRAAHGAAPTTTKTSGRTTVRSRCWPSCRAPDSASAPRRRRMRGPGPPPAVASSAPRRRRPHQGAG